MSESTIARNRAGDPLYRRLRGFLRHLTETYGEDAADTFLELLEACAPGGPIPADTDAAAELKTGVAALERGEWESVRARLDELAAVA